MIAELGGNVVRCAGCAIRYFVSNKVVAPKLPRSLSIAKLKVGTPRCQFSLNPGPLQTPPRPAIRHMSGRPEQSTERGPDPGKQCYVRWELDTGFSLPGNQHTTATYVCN